MGSSRQISIYNYGSELLLFNQKYWGQMKEDRHLGHSSDGVRT